MVATGIPREFARRCIGVAIIASTVTAILSSAPTVAHASPQVQGQSSVYTVQPDDYLSGIAATLGVTLDALLKANNLTVTSAVYPGTRLVIPGNTPLPTYTVKSGDFLNGIAQAAGIRLRELLALNGLQKDSLVLPGDVLRLPRGTSVPAVVSAPTTTAPPSAPPTTPAKVPPATNPTAVPTRYTVQRGDWLIGIAIMHGIKVRDLIAVNDMQLDSLVYEGLVLKLPANAKAPATAPAPAKQPPATPAPVPAPPPVPAPAPTTTTTTPAAPAVPARAASPDVRKVIDFLMAQVGKPYKFFSAGPDSFDCSGLSKAGYAQIGIQLTHYSGAQATAGVAVDWTTQPILAGDLVFTASSSTPGIIGHLGVAIDATRWIHAPRAGDVVRVGNLPSATKILAVRRLVPAA